MIINYEMLRESLSNYKAPDNKIKRMSDRKEIIKLTKNLYETQLNTPGYLVANSIYSPSYLSFDYALAYYGLIPESVYVYTCATYNKKKKKKYINPLGTFLYRDVPSQVYPYDINIMKDGEYTYLIASPEKALCDKLYTMRPVRNKKDLYDLLFNDLRIDKDLFSKLNIESITILCDLYKCTNHKILKKVAGDLNEYNSRTNDQ